MKLTKEEQKELGFYGEATNIVWGISAALLFAFIFLGIVNRSDPGYTIIGKFVVSLILGLVGGLVLGGLTSALNFRHLYLDNKKR